MNIFFIENRESRPDIPDGLRLYALLVEGEDGRYALLDAVDAKSADDFLERAGDAPTPEEWFAFDAPVYAVEINAIDLDDAAGAAAAADALKNPALQLSEEPVLVELTVTPDSQGPADLYDNVVGTPVRIALSAQRLAPSKTRRLAMATRLTASLDADVAKAIPTDWIDHVIALDVGQGSANALVSQAGNVVAYVDVGAGVLKNAGTFPPAMTGLCLAANPVIILTHWHYDHFEMANKFAGAPTSPFTCTWIAPLQTLGPGPQSRMAAALTGKLLVWGGSSGSTIGPAGGAITLERCTASAGNQNSSGIAVWVADFNGDPDILLPGDAGYGYILALSPSAAGLSPRPVTAFAVSHHGGVASGTPPVNLAPKTARAALSYGSGNTYGHPLRATLKKLRTAGWVVGRRGAGVGILSTTRRSSKLYGHILLQWRPGSTPVAHRCAGACGCTVDWTQ